jgi:hypothetical protein
MADCLASELLAFMGTVIADIKTTGGYSQTIPTANISYDAVELIQENFPAAEILLTDMSFEDISNVSQEVSATFRILGYIEQLTEDDATLATKKILMEYAADFRIAVLTAYTKQQGGTFTMEQFEIITPLSQSFAADKNIGMVLTEFGCKFLATRTER